jgi:undecaprenyl-diphosphatase
MEFSQALILGIVQGISEFLPVSSSAHLIIYNYVMSGQNLPLSTNIALHLGTLIAVAVYFLKDWMRIFAEFFKFKKIFKTQLFYLFIGSIPAGVIGILYEKDIEALFHNPKSTVIPLIVFGLLLWIVDSRAKSNSKGIHLMDAIVIGCFQAMALIPGVSRSGSTIVGARLCGLARVDAARFSFLLGTPAMFGATLLKSKAIIISAQEPGFMVALLAATVTGLLAIHFLLSLLRKIGFFYFAIYRIALGAFILLFV